VLVPIGIRVHIPLGTRCNSRPHTSLRVRWNSRPYDTFVSIATPPCMLRWHPLEFGARIDPWHPLQFPSAWPSWRLEFAPHTPLGPVEVPVQVPRRCQLQFMPTCPGGARRRNSCRRTCPGNRDARTVKSEHETGTMATGAVKPEL